ncbi:MAG: PulJ/GspJ family protein [Thermoanaerobaculia bacterium]
MRHWNNQKGLTLIEMIVVTAITSIVVIVSLEMIDGAYKTSQFVESHNDLAVFSQRPMNVMQREIMQSRTVFTESANGTAYRTMIETALTGTSPAPPAGTPVPVTSLLPLNDNGIAFDVDVSGTRKAGNAVLIARQLSPLRIDLGGGNFFNADRYVFEYFYLTQSTARSYRGSGKIMDLAQAQTELVADYNQLVNEASGLTAAQQTTISSALRTAAVTTCRDIVGLKLYTGANDCNMDTAWSPNQPIGSAFYTIPSGNLTWGSPITASNVALAIRNAGSILPELRGGRISGKMNYTIAFGTYQLPRYANSANDPAEKGLEVKIVGPNGFQRVLTRLLLLSEYGVTKGDSQEGFVISQIRGGSVL